MKRVKINSLVVAIDFHYFVAIKRMYSNLDFPLRSKNKIYIEKVNAWKSYHVWTIMYLNEPCWWKRYLNQSGRYRRRFRSWSLVSIYFFDSSYFSHLLNKNRLWKRTSSTYLSIVKTPIFYEFLCNNLT